MDENAEGSGGVPLFFPSAPAQVEPSTPPAPVRTPSIGSWDPRLGPSAIRLDAAAIRAMTESELQDVTLGMLACLKRRPMSDVAAGPAYADGTLAIKSMIAVWILSTVGKTFGRRLVRLSDVDRDSLRSLGGVSRLIKETTVALPVSGAA